MPFLARSMNTSNALDAEAEGEEDEGVPWTNGD